MDERPSPPSWWVGVAGYRFALDDRELRGVLTGGVEPSAVAHAPAWFAGLVCLDDRLLGVVDLGRFLGVSTALSGPLVVPAETLNSPWVLRVHTLEPVPPQALELDASEIRPEAEMAGRVRPRFVGTRRAWRLASGEVIHADDLSLARCLNHPRLHEALA